MYGITEILTLLRQRNIPHTLVEHPAVYTVEDMEREELIAHGEIAKNLFLRDSKGSRHFLVVLRSDKSANLAALREHLDSQKLSFASEARLMNYLGLQKGSVTPFGVLNDTQAAVEVVVDRDLVDLDPIGVHPNTNTATVFLPCCRLLELVRQNGNPITYMTL